MDINQLHDILLEAKKLGAADIHFIVGSPPIMRLQENYVAINNAPITTVAIADGLAQALLNPEDITILSQSKEVIRAYNFSDGLRCRFRVSFQKAVPSLSFHVLSENLPTLESLRLSDQLGRFTKASRGLVLIVGPYGSGRSSTATAMLQEINRTRSTRILTVESPIEYILTAQKSIVEQREVGRDVPTYTEALKELEGEDVSVLYIDRIEDLDVIRQLCELAASRLVIAVAEAPTSVRAIDSLLGLAGSKEASALRAALADVILGVVAQRLVPRSNGGLAVIVELLLGTSPVKAIIREGKLVQLVNILQTSKGEGMISLDQALAEAVKQNEIAAEEALRQAVDEEYLKGILGRD